MLFNREEGTRAETLRHTTLQTARPRFLFLAARIWRQAGRAAVSYKRSLWRHVVGCIMDRVKPEILAPEGEGWIKVLSGNALGYGEDAEATRVFSNLTPTG